MGKDPPFEPCSLCCFEVPSCVRPGRSLGSAQKRVTAASSGRLDGEGHHSLVVSDIAED